MQLFYDRQEAGVLLAKELKTYDRHPNTIVLGLAHGGVVVAAEIAKALHLPFNVLTPRKIGCLTNPELAAGAVTADATVWMNANIVDIMHLTPSWIRAAIDIQLQEAKKLAKMYSSVCPLESLEGKTVILVDDGVATGATLFASIASLKKKRISKLVIAAPVAAKEIWEKIQTLVDEAVCCTCLEGFLGISAFYQHFEAVDDATVIDLLKTQDNS